MARHITSKDVKTTKDILDGWQGKLTWDLLVDALEKRIGFKTTRQAMSRNEEIKEAFNDRKKSLSTTGSFRSRPQSLKIAADRLDRKEAVIERLTKENQRLLEQFEVWLYNATKHGMTKEQLNAAMPKISRRD